MIKGCTVLILRTSSLCLSLQCMQRRIFTLCRPIILKFGCFLCRDKIINSWEFNSLYSLTWSLIISYRTVRSILTPFGYHSFVSPLTKIQVRKRSKESLISQYRWKKVSFYPNKYTSATMSLLETVSAQCPKTLMLSSNNRWYLVCYILTYKRHLLECPSMQN